MSPFVASRKQCGAIAVRSYRAHADKLDHDGIGDKDPNSKHFWGSKLGSLEIVSLRRFI